MSTTPPVIQHAATPPGNIPKGRQTYLMIGVALVIVMAIVFSGSATTSKVKGGTNLPPLAVTPLTKRDIDGLETQLKAAEVQAKLQEAALRKATSAGGTPATSGSTNTGLQGGISGQGIIGPDGKVYYPQQTGAPPGAQAQPAPVNVIAQEKAKMEFTSLFASPIAFSLRPAAVIPTISPVTGTAAPTPASAAQPAPAPAVASAQPMEDRTPQHVLFEGTIIEAVLTNRLAGSFSGPVNVMVTTNVYSRYHHLLIIPQGTRVLGEAKRVAEQNQQRVAVTFHRLLMPDGFTVNLDQFPGLDQVGATGLKDQVNHHYMEVFGTSIALGVLAGFSQFGTGSALTAGGFDSYRQGVASQVSQNSATVLQRQLNRLPDITIREGQRVRIILMKDLELPAYVAHEAEKQ